MFTCAFVKDWPSAYEFSCRSLPETKDRSGQLVASQTVPTDSDDKEIAARIAAVARFRWTSRPKSKWARITSHQNKDARSLWKEKPEWSRAKVFLLCTSPHYLEHELILVLDVIPLLIHHFAEHVDRIATHLHQHGLKKHVDHIIRYVSEWESSSSKGLGILLGAKWHAKQNFSFHCWGACKLFVSTYRLASDLSNRPPPSSSFPCCFVTFLWFC